MSLGLLVLGAVGATIIVSDSRIFESLRARGPKMLGCSQCVGFHVGLWLRALFLLLTVSPLSAVLVLDAALFGCSISICSLLTHCVLVTLGGLGDLRK